MSQADWPSGSSREIPDRVPGLPDCTAGDDVQPAEPGKPCRCYGAAVNEMLFTPERQCSRCGHTWPRLTANTRCVAPGAVADVPAPEGT